MKICPNCGTSVNDDATFCNNCGASLSSAAPAADTNKLASSKPQDVTSQQAPVAPPVMQQNFQQGGFGQPQGQPQGQPYMQQPYIDPKDHTAEFDPKDIEDNKLFAVVPYFFSFIAGVIVGIYVSESQFLKFHIKNALRLDIASTIVALFLIIPFLGWFAGGICMAILIVVRIIAIVNAFSGKAKELPIIGGISFLK